MKYTSPRVRAAAPTPRPLNVAPKLAGADVELGNFIVGAAQPGSVTHAEASRAILRAVRGVERVSEYRTTCNCPACRDRRDAPAPSPLASTSWPAGGLPTYAYNAAVDTQDWGRKYLPTNGGCVYIDADHIELCLPEVCSAYDHVASWRAMLLIATEALDRANTQMPSGQRIVALVNNSDGLGNAYGSHLDMLVTRECFDSIFQRKLHYQLLLASYFASSMVFCGSGKVGVEHGRSDVGFQISARADHFFRLNGLSTMFPERALVNSRDESLCGFPSATLPDDHPSRKYARLHIIAFDNTLNQVACLQRVGVTQLFLAMMEQGQLDTRLILDDPLQAIVAYSHDPMLQATARLASGDAYSAVDIQEAIFERATRFVEEGRAEGLVPRAAEILQIWGETLGLLRRRDFASLAKRVDWVLKWQILEQVMAEQHLTWQSPEIKHLDQIYGSLAPQEGLFWAYEKSGLLERIVTAGEIERFVHEPPTDTRAWLRANLLRRADPASVIDVDWQSLRLKFRQGQASYAPYTYHTLDMSDPFDFTKPRCEERLQEAESLEAFVRGLATDSEQPIPKLITQGADHGNT